MAYILQTKISTDRFTWSRESQTFVAEASDLKEFDLFSRVWDDSCDVGFALVSAKTGKQVTFTETDTLYDIDGDIMAWQFVAYVKNGRDAHLHGIRVLVFND